MNIFPTIRRATQGSTLYGVGGLLDVFGTKLTSNQRELIFWAPRTRKRKGSSDTKPTPAGS